MSTNIELFKLPNLNDKNINKECPCLNDFIQREVEIFLFNKKIENLLFNLEYGERLHFKNKELPETYLLSLTLYLFKSKNDFYFSLISNLNFDEMKNFSLLDFKMQNILSVIKNALVDFYSGSFHFYSDQTDDHLYDESMILFKNDLDYIFNQNDIDYKKCSLKTLNLNINLELSINSFIYYLNNVFSEDSYRKIRYKLMNQSLLFHPAFLSNDLLFWNSFLNENLKNVDADLYQQINHFLKQKICPSQAKNYLDPISYAMYHADMFRYLKEFNNNQKYFDFKFLNSNIRTLRQRILGVLLHE